MTAEIPTAAAEMWKTSPVQSPKAVDIPALLPFDMLCANTNKLSGPGMRVSNMAAPKKDVADKKSICPTPFRCNVALCHYNMQNASEGAAIIYIPAGILLDFML